MNKMNSERRAAVLTALVEGSSIASTCRMFGVNKVTVLRLLADAGTLAAQYHDLVVRDLGTKRVQIDEVWAFCHCKDKNIPKEKRGQFGIGDVWTWVAIDADSKLAITWHVSCDRSAKSAATFLNDVRDRLTNRVQLTTDGWVAYKQGVRNAFDSDVDHAILDKVYASTAGSGRYSPPEVIGVSTQTVCGQPDPAHISTSFVERSNLTVRMSMRRFTRLTNGFSKRYENHEHAVALYNFYYNFIRRHMTVKTTPAVAAKLTDRVWTMLDFVDLLEREERLTGGRLTDYKPATPSNNSLN